MSQKLRNLRHSIKIAKVAARVILAAFLALSITGIAEGGQPSGAKMYRSAEYRYKFLPPAGWMRKTDMPKQTTAYLGPEENDFVVNLTVTVYTAPVKDSDLEQFANGLKIDHGVVSERVQTKLDGHAAYTWRTKLTIPGHPAAENRQVVCVYNHRAYELTMTTPLGLMKAKYDSVFAKWIASFGWLPPSAAPYK